MVDGNSKPGPERIAPVCQCEKREVNTRVFLKSLAASSICDSATVTDGAFVNQAVYREVFGEPVLIARPGMDIGNGFTITRISDLFAMNSSSKGCHS